MELDQKSDDSGNLVPGYDFVSPNLIPEQGDSKYFPKEGPGKGASCDCQWMGKALSEFHPVTFESYSNAASVDQEDRIQSENPTVLFTAENVCTGDRVDVRLDPWHEVTKAVSNLGEQLNENVKVERLQNTNMKVFEDMKGGFKKRQNDVHKRAYNFQTATPYNREAFLDADSDQTFEYNESFGPNFVSMNEESQKLATLVMDSFCSLAKAGNQISTSCNMEAFLDADSDQTFEYNELVGPNFVGSVEVKQEHASPELDSFCSLTESDVKRIPEYVFDGTCNTGHEYQKGEVNLRELCLKVIENTITVQEGHVGLRALESMDKMSTENDGYSGEYWNTQNSGEEGAGEPVSRETSKKKQKRKKKKAGKKMPNSFDTMSTHSITYSSASYMKSAGENSRSKGIIQASDHSFGRGFRLASGNLYDRGMKSSGENSRSKGFIPVSEHFPAKDVRPANENYNTRSDRPASDNLFGRGFRPASGNSHGGGVKSSSEHSFAKGFHQTGETYCSRGVRPTSVHSSSKNISPAIENSYSKGVRPTIGHALAKSFHSASENSNFRGFKPSNEQNSFTKGFSQSSEMLRTRVFRPTTYEHSFARRFGPPPSENVCARDVNQTTGNGFARDNQPPGFNQSKERKVSFDKTSIAKREEIVLYPIPVQENKTVVMRHCSSLAPRFMQRSCDRFGARGPTAHTAHTAGTRKIAVVKPRPKGMEMIPQKMVAPQTESDYIDMVLATDNMFEARSTERKTGPGYKKQSNGVLGDGGTHFQRNVPMECLRQGRGQYNSEGSAESFEGFKAGGRQSTQGTAEQHPDYICGLVGREESEEMERPLQLKHVNWVGKEDIGHFFVSGLNTLNTARSEERSGCHSQPKFLTFDELVLLDGLETAIVSITDPLEMVVANGFVTRFPGSCNLHLLVNEDDRIYPEYIIVCCSCPKLITAHQVGAVMSCPKCRFVRLHTYPEMRIKCQFMLLRSEHMLRFVLISSSLSICDWEKRLQFGWFHDFSASHKSKSDFFISSDQQPAPFSKDLTEFLASLQISDDLDMLSGIDFSNISPGIRLIHTKPGENFTKDPFKCGVSQLQHVIKNLVWRSLKKKQSLYKTERLDQRGYSILNDVFPSALSGDHQASVKHVKVVYPSFRWVDECLANSESPERLKLLSTVADVNSFGDLPWNFLYDLCEDKDFVQNYNVLEQYEKWEEGGKTRKYGWLLTGSQALDTESWGNDFPVYHKVVYKHFQLGVGLFPYLRRNKHSKEVEVCAVDLCDVPLPFDPVTVVKYRHDDMPRLVLGSGQNVFCHCVGIFTKAKSSFGFIKQSPLFKGFLDPFPTSRPGENVFVHASSLSQLKLPPEGSVVEFFLLNQPLTRSHDFIKVCNVFSSVEEAKSHFFAAMPSLADMMYNDMVKAKALSLGIEWIDNVKRMEDAIEDYYNLFFSSQRRGFSYFPTQQQINAISIEPVTLLSDEEWVKDFYKNRRNRGGLSQEIGGCCPRNVLTAFHAMKYRFVKELREVEEWNAKLEEDDDIQKCEYWSD